MARIAIAMSNALSVGVLTAQILLSHEEDPATVGGVFFICGAEGI